MPLYVQPMLNSSFNAMADDTAWRAGVTLWMRSWYQVPAASLPNDDDELCSLAGLGRDAKTWKKIKAKALRGFVEADDGRLYHPVIAEAALEMWINMLLARISSGTGNAKRWKTPFDPAPIEAQIAESYDLLKALNPRADAVLKIDKRNASGSRPYGGGNPGGIPPGQGQDIPPGSQPKPEPEPARKEDADDSASATDWPDIGEVLAELQAVPGLHRAEWQGHQTGSIISWRTNGFSFRQDVLPAVTAVASRLKHQPRSWNFFNDAVAQAYADRTKVIPIPSAQSPPSGSRSSDDRKAAIRQALSGLEADENGVLRSVAR